MRYKIHVFAGNKHPLKIPFGKLVKKIDVRGEDQRSFHCGILRQYITSGHVSRIDIFDRNMTLVDQISG